MNCKLFKETESANRITNKNSKISLLFTIKFGLWTKRVLIDHTVDLRGISLKDGSLAICSAISLMLGSCAHATTKSTIQVNCHTNSHEIETNSQEIRACVNNLPKNSTLTMERTEQSISSFAETVKCFSRAWIRADTGRGRPPWLVAEGVAPVKLVGRIWPVPGEWRRRRLHHCQIQRRRCLPIRRRRARAPWLRLPRGGAKGTEERGGQGPPRRKRREHLPTKPQWRTS
mgnify:CR=1 FL=1